MGGQIPQLTPEQLVAAAAAHAAAMSDASAAAAAQAGLPANELIDLTKLAATASNFAPFRLQIARAKSRVSPLIGTKTEPIEEDGYNEEGDEAAAAAVVPPLV